MLGELPLALSARRRFTIDRIEKSQSARQAMSRDSLGQAKVCRQSPRQVFLLRIKDLQRVVLSTQEARRLPGEAFKHPVPNPPRELHRCRQSIVVATQLLDHTSDRRRVTSIEIELWGWVARSMWKARQVVVCTAAVKRLVVVHRPNDRKAVRIQSELRQQFADLSSRHAGRDRAKLTASALGASGFMSNVSC